MFKLYYLSIKNYEDLDFHERLTFLEIKYGGYQEFIKPSYFDQNPKIKGYTLGYHFGGDRFSPLHHNYQSIYSKYLKLAKFDSPVILELGILNGIGLAIWSDLYPKAKIIGLDYDVNIFFSNIENLKKKNGFSNSTPEVYYFNQFEDNSKTLILIGDAGFDLVIDDAAHTDLVILNSLSEITPYLNEVFIYFIEDNWFVYKKIEELYPDFNVDNTGIGLTVISRGII